jgi:hypothetical protein
VIDIPADAWSQAIVLSGTTTLIPLRLEWFVDVSEFQVVVFRAEFGQGSGRTAWFSDAVSFKD